MPEWRGQYPWLQKALEECLKGNWPDAYEGWRHRVEDELKTDLRYEERDDGTATVWCGIERIDFERTPTSWRLLDGLNRAYHREAARIEAEAGKGVGK